LFWLFPDYTETFSSGIRIIHNRPGNGKPDPAEKTGQTEIACSVFACAPGMGDNLVVKVHYALGSRKR